MGKSEIVYGLHRSIQGAYQIHIFNNMKYKGCCIMDFIRRMRQSVISAGKSDSLQTRPALFICRFVGHLSSYRTNNEEL